MGLPGDLKLKRTEFFIGDLQVYKNLKKNLN